MKYVFYTYNVVWFLGMGCLMARMGYFQLHMSNNRAPGSRGGKIWDADQYNPLGQTFRRKWLRLWAITLAFGFGGLLLMAALDVLAA